MVTKIFISYRRDDSKYPAKIIGRDPKTAKGSVWLVKSQGDPKAMWKSYAVCNVPTAHRVAWADLEGNGKKDGHPEGCARVGLWRRCSSVTEPFRLCSFVAPCQRPTLAQRRCRDSFVTVLMPI